jgi:hypothetical protein
LAPLIWRCRIWRSWLQSAWQWYLAFQPYRRKNLKHMIKP